MELNGMIVGDELDFDGDVAEWDRPAEFADVARYGRRLLDRFVQRARADEVPRFSRIITDHLGEDPHSLSIVEERWSSYEHVNVQTGLDAWLAEPGRASRVIGVSGHRHLGPFDLSDLLADPSLDLYDVVPRPGNIAWTTLPIGPDGETRECLRIAVVLVAQGDERVVLLFRGPDPESDNEDVSIEALANTQDAAARATREIRALAVVHNVYRGQVVSFGTTVFGERSSSLRFHRRRTLDRG